MVEVELNLTVGEVGKVVGHFLIVAKPMPPLHEVTLHLVGGKGCQLVALLALLHGLQLIEKLEYQLAIVTHRYGGSLIFERLRPLAYHLCLGYVNGQSMSSLKSLISASWSHSFCL